MACEAEPKTGTEGPAIRGLADGDRRQTAAVAFADIVGYSILMSTEGDATHLRWMELLHGTLRPLGWKHGSTVVKSTGDGVVADFPTVADAFAWAEAVQRATRATAGATVPPVAFRIAIDHGDMHVTDGDVYGTTVNIAARLQDRAAGRHRVDAECPPALAESSAAA